MKDVIYYFLMHHFNVATCVIFVVVEIKVCFVELSLKHVHCTEGTVKEKVNDPIILYV